jgi:TRAP-type C4-dicarboxylate transport system permease small subunit
MTTVSEAAPQGAGRSASSVPVMIASWMLGFVAVTILFAMMVLTFIDVWGRYAFNTPIYGSYEVTEFMMGVLIFASLPILCAREGHVTIDILDGVMPRRWVTGQRLVVNLISAAVLALIAWRLWIYADDLRRNVEVTMTLKIPHAPFCRAFAALAGIASLACLINCWGYWRGTRSPVQTLS